MLILSELKVEWNSTECFTPFGDGRHRAIPLAAARIILVLIKFLIVPRTEVQRISNTRHSIFRSNKLEQSITEVEEDITSVKTKLLTLGEKESMLRMIGTHLQARTVKSNNVSLLEGS